MSIAKRIRLYGKVAGLFLRNRIVTEDDIGRSYDVVSSGYNDAFLKVMAVYNDELLGQAVRLLGQRQGLSVLNLACGTGYNIGYLSRAYPDSHFDAA